MGRAVALRCSSLLISIKSPWRILVLILCVSFFIYLIYGVSSRSSLPSAVADYTVEHVPKDTKIILFWTKYFGEENHHLRDNLNNCPVSNCFLTNDRKYLRASSAVIFHGNEFDAQDLPGIRFPNQSYVIFLMESPPFTVINLKQAFLQFNVVVSS
ncbi:alpha-(1,3)-fucosyltransferase C-like [Paramacrobiotus metropolitanus]|uniref:alpha-(1,3)-fucosyltransferase C-like n=1 Tax=Paramacrobiotus metropolitanus TaxID=2943436 RepID=UPI0024455F44|nr:alpha-(1,3)-fucosyltransferase C-like [Paramacrobiotus metropolitanus]